MTPYIWRHKELFRCGQLMSPVDYSHLRWTVDNGPPTRRFERWIARRPRPGMEDVLRYLATHPEIAAGNEAFIGKEGYLDVWQGSEKSKG